MTRRNVITSALCLAVLGSLVGVVRAEEATGEDPTLAVAAADEDLTGSTSASGVRRVKAAEIKTRIAALQDAVSTAKNRLDDLAERVLSGGIAQAKLVAVHRNEMGSSFKLVRAHYALDGAPIFSRVDESGELAEQEELELFSGYVVSGRHTITASLEYRGHGYGIFSYLKGYRFKVRSTHTFEVPEGKVLSLRVTAYEKGDQTTPLQDRPDIRYGERTEALTSR